MEVSGTIKQSNGFLPPEPLMHADPTAIGIWDLGADDARGPAYAAPTPGARDQLLLIRLHHQPLTILYLPQPPGTEDAGAVLEATWSAAASAVTKHIRSCGCLPEPAGAREFAAALAADDRRCPQLLPTRPAGAAAVILCTLGHEQLLTRCLEALTRMSCSQFEIVVVDNRPSEPGTRELVSSFSHRALVRYVAEPRPGLAVARNAGVAAAEWAQYVAFTDDDVVVDEQWLARLLAAFSDPLVDAVSGLVLPLTLRSVAQKRFEQYAGFGKGVRGERYDLHTHRADDRFLYPYWGGMFGSGNSMAFRRDALLSVGGFDPALGAGTPTGGGEDLAAFTDVILAGGRVVYEPGSICWHEHRSLEDALRRQVLSYGVGLTAVLWRYLWRDPRFSATLVRSLPSILRLIQSRSEDRQAERLPADLARLELRGRLLGPWRYMVSSRGARSHSVAGSAGSDQRVSSVAAQAGDQTRT